VIADDSALVRDGLRHALTAHGHDVIATATDAPELLETVARDPPDIAVIDIRMPPTHTTEGLQAAAEIRDRGGRTGVLILSQYVDADYAFTLLRTNPARSGYLLKDRITQLDTLLDALRRLHDGGTVLDEELVDLLLHRPAAENRLEQLTDRERTVLALVAEGLSDRAIAERLWLTQKTVETHIRHILGKLGLPPDADHNRRVLAVLEFLRNA
jgi:DNA-binding NarL/FixJ family response regulator